MVESLAYEDILERMLERVPADVDKREGSVIFDACAPAAAELAQLYVQLEVQQRLFFGTTASGEYLDLRVADFGVERQPATKARRQGLFYGRDATPLDIPLGSRYSGDSLNFVVVERLAEGRYALECEQTGSGGNSYFGKLVPISFVQGLEQAELGAVLIPGEDVESDETLRSRYLHRVRNPSSGGNAADYRDWALEVAGVGGAKIYPLWNGNGSVKVVIVNSDKAPASPALVAEAANYIESMRPIGAAVTVVSATAKPIDLTAKVKLAAGYSLQEVTDALTEAFAAYLRSIAFEASYVSIAQAGVLLLSVQGVADYSDLQLNGSSANVVLVEEAIPALGDVQLEV